MYGVLNNRAYINGESGPYDGIVKNNFVRYGRNSVANQKGYLDKFAPSVAKPEFPDLNGLSAAKKEEFEAKLTELEKAQEVLDNYLSALPPVNFEQKYAPDNKLNKQALMGAAYEEMGQRTAIAAEELTGRLQEAFGGGVDARALDTDNNGEIDLAEYSASILVADMLSTDDKSLDIKNINGIVTNEGQNASVAFAAKQNYDFAAQTYGAIAQALGLKESAKEFVSDKNNTI